MAERAGPEQGECGGGQGVAEAEAGVDAEGLVECVGLGVVAVVTVAGASSG